MNAHYDTLLTEDVTRWDDLLSNQLSLAMECLVVRPGEQNDCFFSVTLIPAPHF